MKGRLPRAEGHRVGLAARRGFRRVARHFEPTTAAPLPCRTSADWRVTPICRTLPVSDRLPVLSGSRASPRRMARPSQVSDRLWPDGHVARSPVASRPPRMSGCRPGIVTSREAASFPRAERRSSRVPTWLDCSRSGTVSGRASLASASSSRLSWLSSSRPPFHRAVPGPQGFRPGPSDRSDRKSPRQPRCTRVSALAPRAGFAPASHHRGLLSPRRHFPVAPVLRGINSIG